METKIKHPKNWYTESVLTIKKIYIFFFLQKSIIRLYTCKVTTGEVVL